MLVRFRVPLILLLAGLGFLPRIFSQAGSQHDKRGYNLLNPTPEALLREFATDRPDRTESPFTVDAGHLQVEIDLLNYTYDCANAHGAHETLKALAIAPINFKVGLLNTDAGSRCEQPDKRLGFRRCPPSVQNEFVGQ